MAKRVLIAGIAVMLLGLGLFISASVREGEHEQVVKVGTILSPKEVKSGKALSIEPDTIKYDSGVGYSRIGNPNTYVGVRFTPLHNFNLNAVYFWIDNELSNITDGCSLYIAYDDGNGKPLWPATLFGVKSPPLLHGVWMQFDIANPTGHSAGKDFHIIYGPAPGWTEGWWAPIDNDGSISQRSNISYDNGNTWQTYDIGDFFIRAGGVYAVPADRDTIAWRTLSNPTVNFNKRYDSLAVWFQAPADLKVLAVRFMPIDFTGNMLIDIFETPYAGYSGNDVDANGWLGDGNHPALTGLKSPLGAHVAGPVPKTISDADHGEWVTVDISSHPEFSVGDYFCISTWHQATAGSTFAAEDPDGDPYSLFTYDSTRPGPSGQKGWHLRSNVLWYEVDVEVATHAFLIADHIKNTYLQGRDPNDPFSSHLYVRGTELSSGDSIYYGYFPSAFSSAFVYVASAGEYLAWINDVPSAMFEHPSRIVIATVNGVNVTVKNILDTQIPVILNNHLIWANISSAAGSDLYFPDSTFWDLIAPSRGKRKKEPGEQLQCKPSFQNGQNASALEIYCNQEEPMVTNTHKEMSDILDDCGIPKANRGILGFRACAATRDDYEQETVFKNAIAQAGAKSSGEEMVIALHAHGGRGLFQLNHGKWGTGITYQDFICWICEALENTPKRRILLLIEACRSGTAISTLNVLECEDCVCDGFEIGIAASCRSEENSYNSNDGGGDPDYAGPGDFFEEMEDEGEDWDDDEDMMDVAEDMIENQLEGDMDHDDQHPTWGHRCYECGEVCENRGDPTGDGQVNVMDVLAVVNHVLDIVPLEGGALCRANCNGDETVNIMDALGTANVVLGIGECAPIATKPILTPEVMDFLESSVKPHLLEENFARFMALVKSVTILPTEFSLAQNYPNPFNPTTSIQYSVVSDQTTHHSPLVTLKIYNLLGQEMRTLVDEAKEVGYYTVMWDSKDELGRDVSSGIYFYRLTAAEFTATRRMVLLK